MKSVSVVRCGSLFVLLVMVALSLPIQAQPEPMKAAPPPFSREELSQLLAPIALYPDALLSQILMASTYPIEIIEAERWITANPVLSGEELDAQLVHFDWAPSVKTLCHFPVVLTLMSERIAQTTDLGNAFLFQEESVMSIVQELRAQAREAGNLANSREQKIIVEKETIIIEPTDPRVVYVPLYNPYVSYGGWRYPSHVPYYWIPTGMRVGNGIRYWPGYQFHFVLGSWSLFDWQRRTIVIDPVAAPVFFRHDHSWPERRIWHHEPYHRHGIPYHNKPFRDERRRPSVKLETKKTEHIPLSVPPPPAKAQQPIPAKAPLLPKKAPSHDDMNQQEWYGTPNIPQQELPPSRPSLEESFPASRERGMLPGGREGSKSMWERSAR